MTSHRKNSQLCPNCRGLISRDEPVCPYCGMSAPGSWWKNTGLLGIFHDPALFLKGLNGINIAFFVLSLLLSLGNTGMSMNPFDFLSPNNQSLFLLGATGRVPIDTFHRWWSLISASYLHGSLLHLVFNLIALRQIGPLIIQEYGLARMFCIYTFGGVGGFMLSYLAGVTFTIGASAAVCALVGAALYYGKSRGGNFGGQVYQQVGGWALSIFVFGLLVPGINNWAHGGGMAAGALCGLLMGYRDKRQETFGHRLTAGACALMTVLALVWALMTALVYRAF